MYGTEFGPLADAPSAPSYIPRDEITLVEAQMDAFLDEQEWSMLSNAERAEILLRRDSYTTAPDPWEAPSYGEPPF